MGALEASRDTETGEEAFRAAPVPGPTAERGARAAMADQGARAAMADQGIQEAMAGPPPRGALGGALEERTLHSRGRTKRKQKTFQKTKGRRLLLFGPVFCHDTLKHRDEEKCNSKHSLMKSHTGNISNAGDME